MKLTKNQLRHLIKEVISEYTEEDPGAPTVDSTSQGVDDAQWKQKVELQTNSMIKVLDKLYKESPAAIRMQLSGGAPEYQNSKNLQRLIYDMDVEAWGAMLLVGGVLASMGAMSNMEENKKK